MKKVGIVILIICIIVLLIITGNLYSKKENDLAVQEEENQEVENKIFGLENNTEKDEVSFQESEDSEELNSEFDANKMKLKAEDGIYTGIENDSDWDIGVTIVLQDNKVYLDTDANNGVIQTIFPDVTESVSNQEITGFSSSVVSSYIACFGNGIGEDSIKILFLMEDGTVEYVKYKDIIGNNNYTSSGKLDGVSDIVKFENASVSFYDENENFESSGLTVVAIDKNGYAYDLDEVF